MSRFALVVPIMAGAGLILGTGAVIAQTQGAGQPEPCTYAMGPRMMGGYGPGMMGRPGQGMMGWNGSQQRDLNLSVADAKEQLDRWVAWMGNPRLKAGAVVEKDASTITADVVTADKDILVERFNINRRTGYWQPTE